MVSSDRLRSALARADRALRRLRGGCPLNEVDADAVLAACEEALGTRIGRGAGIPRGSEPGRLELAYLVRRSALMLRDLAAGRADPDAVDRVLWLNEEILEG